MQFGALKFNRPKILPPKEDEYNNFEVRDVFHPLIAKMNSSFVTNSVKLDGEAIRAIFLTGPSFFFFFY